jgi:protein phosphatase
VLTRSVGVEAKVSVDRKDISVQPGDRFLLCSDGLSDLVSESEILRVLGSKDGDLGALADELIAAANTAGGHDNISVVVAEVE